eukprot:jgi/Botrbrau1/9999/Bobra.0012s0088.1
MACVAAGGNSIPFWESRDKRIAAGGEVTDSASGYAVSSFQTSEGLAASGTPESSPPGGLASTTSRDAQPDSTILWVNPWSESGDAASPVPATGGQGLEGVGGLAEEATDDMVQFLGYASGATSAPSVAPHRLTLLSDMMWGASAAEGAAPAPAQSLEDAAIFSRAVFPTSGRLMETLAKMPNATMFQNLLVFTGLSNMLQDDNATWTLFVPQNEAWTTAFQLSEISCTKASYYNSPCTNPDQLLQATNLRQLLLNHIVRGPFDLRSLPDGTRLLFEGGSVHSIWISPNSDQTVYVGAGAIVLPDVDAGIGIIHLLNKVLTTDASFNTTMIAAAEKLMGFGPFNTTQREQFFGYGDDDLPATVPSLLEGYMRVRSEIDLPDGGLANPCALTYNPAAIMSIPRRPGRSGRVPPGPSSGQLEVHGGPRGTVGVSPTLGTLSAGSVGQGLLTTSGARDTAPTLGAAGFSGSWAWNIPEHVKRPADNETLAFMTLLELASLIRSRQVTAVELAEIFFARMQRYDAVLEGVITFTEELARQQAEAADALLAQGIYRGPLHGIPYGLKDIIAVAAYRTTWGDPAYQHQFINQDATVYIKLRNAGAVLLAKLASGAMAFDDVWWGGQVKNPWNVAEGASGSSAGSASAVSAGLVVFALGSETQGSLVSPAERNGVTALRPSFGTIGRTGTMSLAESLDKIGPVCRSAMDCAVIYDVLRGRDPGDPASVDVPQPDPFSLNVSGITVGLLSDSSLQASEVALTLQAQGVRVIEMTLNYSAPAVDLIMPIMMVEAASNFDRWQRAHFDDLARRQDFWPPLLRLARVIPAVEYIQAQRARTKAGTASAAADGGVGDRCLHWQHHTGAGDVELNRLAYCGPASRL